MSDIEKSFTYLQDNIPQWLQDVATVEEKVTAMQEDNINVPISQSPFGKRRSDSIDSIRLDAIVEDTAPSNGTNTALAGSRKRKSLSVSSGRQSSSSRHRKTMVVVSYDGDTQKSFELLVRAIGTGRNMLRKAKIFDHRGFHRPPYAELLPARIWKIDAHRRFGHNHDFGPAPNGARNGNVA